MRLRHPSLLAVLSWFLAILVIGGLAVEHFRSRVDDLETENMALRSEVKTLRSEIMNLRADAIYLKSQISRPARESTTRSDP
jgi:cell division protein FtsB